MIGHFLIVLVFTLSSVSETMAIGPEKTYSTTTAGGSLDGTILLDSPNRTLQDYIKDYLDVPPDAVDWKVFATTKEKTISGKTQEGYDFQYLRPEFKDELKKLDGKPVFIKGFMFPLDGTKKQKLFLIGPFPISCPFHYHVTASMIVEVHADKTPITFTYDPILLSGTLQLVEKDPENSVFYRLLDAKIVKSK